jgi:hypothetical protein
MARAATGAILYRCENAPVDMAMIISVIRDGRTKLRDTALAGWSAAIEQHP